tara:strand:+ start:43 stop:609 length:567 start_codon:yes stop_codon:yes gene_type:complete
METSNLERYLESFGKYIVKQARTNLTKGKKNVDKNLYNSLSFKVVEDSGGFTLELYMADYGTFVDKGVSGTKKAQKYTDYKGETKTTPYKRAKQPPSGLIERWIKKRGIRGRVDKKWKSAGNRGGQFITDKSFAFLISRSIKFNGTKGISFFQRPLMLGLKRFRKEMLSAVKKDILNTLDKAPNTTVK